MKNIFKTTIIAVLLVAAPVIISAQTPPHPNGGATPATGSNTSVGSQFNGVPVGNGNLLLLSLALLYAGKKIKTSRQQQTKA